MRLVPITQKAARNFITAVHRHHKAPVGALFQIACMEGSQIFGVIIVGRPVARALQDGSTCEVIRLATTGSKKNVCSFLYGAAWRAAKAIGYTRIITYILNSETGASLRAVGWNCEGSAGGGEWSVPSRPRQLGLYPTCKKVRYSQEYNHTPLTTEQIQVLKNLKTKEVVK